MKKLSFLLSAAVIALSLITTSCDKEGKALDSLKSTVWIDDTTEAPTVYKLEFDANASSVAMSADMLGAGMIVMGEDYTVSLSGTTLEFKQRGGTEAVVHRGTYKKDATTLEMTNVNSEARRIYTKQ